MRTIEDDIADTADMADKYVQKRDFAIDGMSLILMFVSTMRRLQLSTEAGWNIAHAIIHAKYVPQINKIHDSLRGR